MNYTVPPAIEELAAYNQWMLHACSDKDGGPNKIPCDAKEERRLVYADYKCSGHWSDFETAARRWFQPPERRPWRLGGLSFVLSDWDEFTCIDLDDCVDARYDWDRRHAEGHQDAHVLTINEFALQILARFPNTYAEYSPSLTGVHIWVRGKLPPGEFLKTKTIEIYSREKPLTVAMQPIEGRDNLPIADYQDELMALFSEYRTQRRSWQGAGVMEVTPSSERELTPADIRFLSERLPLSKKDKYEAFIRLWNGDLSEYDYDPSRADYNFFSLLRPFGLDPDAGVRLWRASKLNRPLTKKSSNYLARTIAAAWRRR